MRTNSASAPTSSNNTAAGYNIGDQWKDSTTGYVWRFASESAGAATWEVIQTSDGSAPVEPSRLVSLTGGATTAFAQLSGQLAAAQIPAAIVTAAMLNSGTALARQVPIADGAGTASYDYPCCIWRGTTTESSEYDISGGSTAVGTAIAFAAANWVTGAEYEWEAQLYVSADTGGTNNITVIPYFGGIALDSLATTGNVVQDDVLSYRGQFRVVDATDTENAVIWTRAEFSNGDGTSLTAEDTITVDISAVTSVAAIYAASDGDSSVTLQLHRYRQIITVAP